MRDESDEHLRLRCTQVWLKEIMSHKELKWVCVHNFEGKSGTPAGKGDEAFIPWKYTVVRNQHVSCQHLSTLSSPGITVVEINRISVENHTLHQSVVNKSITAGSDTFK
jgi:hypothetical protein